MSRPNLIFFHVCCVGKWKEVLPKMLGQLVTSGLLEKAKLYFGVLGQPATLKEFYKVCHAAGVQSFECKTCEDLKQFEHFTMSYLHDVVKSLTLCHNVLYLHTKAVTRTGPRGVFFHQWRDYMVYCVVTRWRHAVKMLEERDAVAVSVNYRSGPKPHFAGNLWWSTSDHLKGLPSTLVVRSSLKSRFQYIAPEVWVLWGAPLGRVYTMHQPPHLIRSYGIHPSIYVDQPLEGCAVSKLM